MARAIGIDIGARSFKVVEVEGGGKKFRILRFYKEEIPQSESEADVSEFLSSALQKALKKNRFRADQVAVAVNSCNTILREIEVPFTSLDQIRKTIRFEAEHVIHSCNIEEVIVDFFKMKEGADTSQVMIIAVLKEALKRNLEILERIGLDPIMVDLDVGALYNVFALTDISRRFKSALVIDIGARSTKMFVVENGKLLFIRAIRMGADSLTDAIQRDLELDFGKAEEKKMALFALPEPSPGNRPPLAEGRIQERGEAEEGEKPEIEKSHVELERELIVQKEEEYLSRVSREVNRFLAGVRQQYPVEAVFLTGGGSRLRGMKGHLQEVMGREVHDLDILSFVSHPFQENEVPLRNADIPIALGLGVKLLGCDPLGMDFRKEEFRFQKKFDQVKVALGSCITLIFLLFLLTGVFFKKNLEEYQERYDQIVNAAGNKFKEAERCFQTKTDKDRVNALRQKSRLERLSHMNGLLSSMNRKFEPELSDVEFPSAFEFMGEFFKNLEKAGFTPGEMFITKMDCSQKGGETISFEGFIESTKASEVMGRVKAALQAAFKVTDRGLVPDRKTGNSNFSLLVERKEK